MRLSVLASMSSGRRAAVGSGGGGGGRTPDFYVSTTGNDTTGNGSEALPWRTIAKGVSMLSGGQVLQVKNGTYSGTTHFIQNPPSGTAGTETLITAETIGGVRINNGGSSLGSSNNPLRLVAKQYVDIVGFIFDMESYDPEHMAYIESDYIRVRSCGFRRSGEMNDYAGWLVFHGNYNLAEDCYGVGGARYGFEQGGPSETCTNNIFRRCVGRMDYSGSGQPKRTFTTYGNEPTATGVRDHWYQNCIAIDGGDVDTGRGGSPEPKYSSMGCGKNATNVRHDGCLAIVDYAYYAGIWISTNGANGRAVNCTVWGMTGPAVDAIRADGATPTVTNITTNTTHGLNQGGSFSTPSSSLVTAGSPTDVLNNTPGAVVLKRFGTTGTRWGETGYDQLTSDDLWPFPNQALIKSLFSEANATSSLPSNYLPRTNTTTRGFCAAGTGLYGGPITLSSYIFELTGTACPAQYA